MPHLGGRGDYGAKMAANGVLPGGQAIFARTGRELRFYNALSGFLLSALPESVGALLPLLVCQVEPPPLTRFHDLCDRVEVGHVEKGG